MFVQYFVGEEIIPANGLSPQKHLITIIDNDFSQVISANYTKHGLDVMTPIILTYENRDLNVGHNAFKAFMHLCKRFTIKDPKAFLDRMASVNYLVAKYKEDIEKYIALM